MLRSALIRLVSCVVRQFCPALLKPCVSFWLVCSPSVVWLKVRLSCCYDNVGWNVSERVGSHRLHFFAVAVVVVIVVVVVVTVVEMYPIFLSWRASPRVIQTAVAFLLPRRRTQQNGAIVYLSFFLSFIHSFFLSFFLSFFSWTFLLCFSILLLLKLSFLFFHFFFFSFLFCSSFNLRVNQPRRWNEVILSESNRGLMNLMDVWSHVIELLSDQVVSGDVRVSFTIDGCWFHWFECLITRWDVGIQIALWLENKALFGIQSEIDLIGNGTWIRYAFHETIFKSHQLF